MNILEILNTHDNETYQKVMSFKEKIRNGASDSIIADIRLIIDDYLSRAKEICPEDKTTTLSAVIADSDKLNILVSEYGISKNAILAYNEGLQTISRLDYSLKKNNAALKALLDLFFILIKGLSYPVLGARCDYPTPELTDKALGYEKPIKPVTFKPKGVPEAKKPETPAEEKPKPEPKPVPDKPAVTLQKTEISEEKPIEFKSEPKEEALENEKMPFTAPIQLLAAEDEVVEDAVIEKPDENFRIVFADKKFFYIEKKTYSLSYEGEAEGYEFLGYENNEQSEVGEHIVKASFRSPQGEVKVLEATMTITDVVDGIQYICVGDSAHVAGYDENIQRIVKIPSHIEFSDKKFVVDEIEKEAFDSCPKAKEIIVPDTVKKIGAGAFVDCSKLTKLTLPFIGADPKSNDSYISYIFGGKRETDNQFFLPKSLDTVIITKQDEVKPNAFQGARYIKNITLSKECRTIGKNAFCKCESLENLTNTDKISNIQDNAFQSCKKLKSFNISKNLQKVGDHAFKDCFILKFYSYIPLDKIKEPMFKSTWNESGRPIINMVK